MSTTTLRTLGILQSLLMSLSLSAAFCIGLIALIAWMVRQGF